MLKQQTIPNALKFTEYNIYNSHTERQDVVPDAGLGRQGMNSKIRTGKLKTRKPRAGRHNHEGVHEKGQRDTRTTSTYKILR